MLDALSRGWLWFAAAAVIAFAAGLVAAASLEDQPDGIVFGYGSGLEPGSPIRVQVAGAVVSPGVYDLREGDRLLEALAAAGGPAADADTEGLHLARRVRDEERIEVPRRLGATGGVVPIPGERLDINSATIAQLDALPGIGQAYSRRIVDSRQVDGPFKTTRDLIDRRVLPVSTFEQIRDLIFAGP